MRLFFPKTRAFYLSLLFAFRRVDSQRLSKASVELRGYESQEFLRAMPPSNPRPPSTRGAEATPTEAPEPEAEKEQEPDNNDDESSTDCPSLSALKRVSRLSVSSTGSAHGRVASDDASNGSEAVMGCAHYKRKCQFYVSHDSSFNGKIDTNAESESAN